MNRWQTLLMSLVLIVAMTALMEGRLHASESEAEPATVFLVRHAEKTGEEKDPGLTESGVARAADLATTLRDAGIEYILSSDYRRTRDTAIPLAETLGVSIEIYDPRDLPGLATRLAELGGRVLVVGHSNTTPAVAELLGGESGPPIDEAEHDRLYVLSMGIDGMVSTVLIRYGAH
jgi:broad specificity phosphatase PhoE